MANKHKAAKPGGELIRNAQEISNVEQYWHLAGRAAPRIPPKDYRYVEELAHLQFELIKLQEWVRLHGLRVCVLFEGRDAAGKGGVIKRMTQSLNPRICRVVALGTPTEKERGQWYFQRYAAQLPSRGEIVLFDRSWYNRAGVEHVMGFCTAEEYEEFLRACPLFEEMLIRAGITLVKYWFSINDEEQEKRFQERMRNPIKRWKLSRIDIESRRRWVDYSQAKDVMFAHTETKKAPWYVVNADEKKRARLNCIAHCSSRSRIGIWSQLRSNSHHVNPTLATSGPKYRANTSCLRFTDLGRLIKMCNKGAHMAAAAWLTTSHAHPYRIAWHEANAKLALARAEIYYLISCIELFR